MQTLQEPPVNFKQMCKFTVFRINGKKYYKICDISMNQNLHYKSLLIWKSHSEVMDESNL